MVWFDQQGFDGCSLTGELVLPLGGPTLDVILSSMDSRSLLLLMGSLLL
jgi:hypothetical protein